MLTGLRRSAFFLAVAIASADLHAAGVRPADDAEVVPLSEVISTKGKALRDATGEGDIPMLIDASDVSPEDAHAALFAVQDVQSAGREVVAIVEDEVSGGGAVVAAGCKGIALLPRGRLTGCTDDWCASPSMRSSMAQQMAAISGHDAAVTERTLGGTDPLSYSTAQGVQRGTAGGMVLASKGRPMKLDAAALQALGWAGPPHADRAAAVAAIAAGLGTGSTGGSAGGSTGSKRKPPPSGTPPVPPSGKQGVPPPAGKQGAVPPPAAGSGAVPAAATQKLSAIQTDLAALKKLIEEFNLYFIGEKGAWDQKSKGLREVWKTGEMTKDQPTKKKSTDLQTAMRQKASAIARNIRSIKGAAKGAAIPQQAQLDTLEDVLREFQASLETDDPDKYSRSSAAIMGTKIP